MNINLFDSNYYPCRTKNLQKQHFGGFAAFCLSPLPPQEIISHLFGLALHLLLPIVWLVVRYNNNNLQSNQITRVGKLKCFHSFFSREWTSSSLLLHFQERILFAPSTLILISNFQRGTFHLHMIESRTNLDISL